MAGIHGGDRDSTNSPDAIMMPIVWQMNHAAEFEWILVNGSPYDVYDGVHFTWQGIALYGEIGTWLLAQKWAGRPVPGNPPRFSGALA